MIAIVFSFQFQFIHYLNGSGIGWYPSRQSQDGNNNGEESLSDDCRGLRTASITEVPLEPWPVCPSGPITIIAKNDKQVFKNVLQWLGRKQV